jgi:hypothetical protein
MIELIFVLLGCLVVWLGLTGHVVFNPRGIPWMVLSAAMIIWGVRALYQPGRWWAFWENTTNTTRGLSLVLLGILMLAIAYVPFTWGSRMLAAGGVLLVFRGVIGVVLVLGPR